MNTLEGQSKKCPFCKKDFTEFITSHLIPKWIIDKKERKSPVHVDLSANVAFKRTGVESEKGLMCTECEKKSSDPDKYVAENFRQNFDSNFKMIFSNPDEYVYVFYSEKVDKIKVKKFVIWCLLRCYFSKKRRNFFQDDIPSYHLENMIDIIMNPYASADNYCYLTYLTFHYSIYVDKIDSITTYPTKFRYSGHNGFSFTIGWLQFNQIVSSHANQSNLTTVPQMTLSEASSELIIINESKKRDLLPHLLKIKMTEKKGKLKDK